MKAFYFGGQFNFLYKDFSIENISKDYRSKILGDYNLWLNKPNTNSVQINKNALYVGPFYFTDYKDSEHIVSFESSCIEKATDCVFVLSNNSAPGTITEIIQAVFLNKNIYIFYVNKDIPSNEIDTPVKNDLWYPIIFAKQNSKNIKIFEFDTYNDAVISCVNYFNELIK